MNLRLRFDFEFDLEFLGFLPEKGDDILKFSFDDGKFLGKLFMIREKHRGWITDFAEDNIANQQNIYSKGLTFELEISDIDADLMQSIEIREVTDKTETFGKEILPIVLKVYSGIADYFRNVGLQYWIEPPNQAILNLGYGSLQQLFNKFEARWYSEKDNGFNPLFVSNQPIMIKATMRKGVDKEAWLKIPSLIESGYSPPMRKVLLANSFLHLNQNDGRLAIVEGVTAWENTYKALLAKVIVKLPGISSVREDALDKIIQNTGLRTITEVGLNMIKDLAGLDEKDISLVCAAIEERNRIIHQSQKRVDIEKAKQYIYAIKKVMDNFENWVNLK
jgi:hypothetical protein